MSNIITIDVEDWYMTHDFNFDRKFWSSCDDRVVCSTEIILNILEKNSTKATFFILGCVAKKHPELVKKIDLAGHEIGTHGMWHKKLFDFNQESFKMDIIESRDILESIISKKVVLHRAPSWTINSNNLWVLEVLDELGFICDSSIQPFNTPLSGFKNALEIPFKPIINGKRLNIIEFPQTIFKLKGIKMPFSGGFYFRFMPYLCTKYLLKLVSKQRDGMVYFHPWEFDLGQPRIKTGIHKQFIHYYNIKNNAIKLEKLLKDFEFKALGSIINDDSFNERYHNLTS